MSRLAGWGLLAALLGAVTSVVLAAGGDVSLAGPSVLARSLAVVAGVALLLVPAVTAPGLPGRRALAAAGAAWLLAEWANPEAPGGLAFTVGLLCLGAALPLVLAGGLARLPGRAGAPAGLAFALALLGAFLLGPGLAVLGDPQLTGCPDCPRDLVAVSGAGQAVTWLLRAGSLAALAAGAMAVVAVALASAGVHRLTVAPVLSGTPLPAALVAVSSAGEAFVLLVQGPGQPAGFDLHAIASTGLLLVAVAMLSPVVQARLALRAVVRAVAADDAEGAPRSVEDTLRGALGDPGLRVAYPVGDRWQDVAARAVAVPLDGSTMVTDAGRTLAALVHGQSPAPHPTVVAAALAGARLHLDVERIQAGETHRVAELQAARRRAADAADAARTRLERDLHDGAQQRLVALRFTLGAAWSRADRLGAPAVAATLAEADAAAEQAVAELRELAHGIGGSTVEALGLVEAARAATERAGGCLAVAPGSDRDLPQVVSRAAYATVVEGLAVATQAGAAGIEVRLQREPAHLVVSVTCAVRDTPGAALEASALLDDRIALLGGTLSVVTTDGPVTRISTLTAELPCE